MCNISLHFLESKNSVAPLTNPSAIYTYPEIASIGKTETALKEEGTEFKIAKFPFSPLAKAKIEGGTEGFIKIIYGVSHRELLGVHIVGAKATDLIGEFVLGKILETTVVANWKSGVWAHIPIHQSTN